MLLFNKQRNISFSEQSFAEETGWVSYPVRSISYGSAVKWNLLSFIPSSLC